MSDSAKIGGRTTFLCGGETGPGTRVECPNVAHDWPLPDGYADAHVVASSRLSRGWRNYPCPACGRYGWEPGRARSSDIRVPAPHS